MPYADSYKRMLNDKARRRQLKRVNTSIKLNKSCKICGYSQCADALTWHHTNPNNKQHEISDLKSFSSQLRETDKCICVCANCHAEIHAGLHPEYLIEKKADDEQLQQTLFGNLPQI